MAKIDELKESIAYAKLILGVMIATMLSLCGWIAGNLPTNNIIMLILAFIIEIGLIIISFRLHKHIRRMIKLVGKL